MQLPTIGQPFATPLILFNAFRQLQSPLAELLDTAPPPDSERHVRKVAGAAPGVIGLEKCFVRKVGFRHYADLHVVVRSLSISMMLRHIQTSMCASLKR